MKKNRFIGIAPALIVWALLVLTAGPVWAAYDTEDLPALRVKAEHNDADAQFALGWRYYEGTGAPANYGEATRWLKKAAGHGHAEAQYYLGLIYEYGKGTKIDYAAARQWLMKSADQDNAQAQAALGWMYQNGWGVKHDTGEACYWFMLSSIALHLPSGPQCNDVSALLSPAQVAQARERAQNWLVQQKQKSPAPSVPEKKAHDG